jgi:DNA-binding XRE family transcriptional regulator
MPDHTNSTPRPLAALRKEKDLTQPQLAEQAGINKDTVVNIEKAHTVPTLANAQKLARALGVCTDAIAWPQTASAQPTYRQGRYAVQKRFAGFAPPRYPASVPVEMAAAVAALEAGQSFAMVEQALRAKLVEKQLKPADMDAVVEGVRTISAEERHKKAGTTSPGRGRGSRTASPKG